MHGRPRVTESFTIVMVPITRNPVRLHFLASFDILDIQPIMIKVDYGLTGYSYLEYSRSVSFRVLLYICHGVRRAAWYSQ